MKNSLFLLIWFLGINVLVAQSTVKIQVLEKPVPFAPDTIYPIKDPILKHPSGLEMKTKDQFSYNYNGHIGNDYFFSNSFIYSYNTEKKELFVLDPKQIDNRGKYTIGELVNIDHKNKRLICKYYTGKSDYVWMILDASTLALLKKISVKRLVVNESTGQYYSIISKTMAEVLDANTFEKTGKIRYEERSYRDEFPRDTMVYLQKRYYSYEKSDLLFFSEKLISEYDMYYTINKQYNIDEQTAYAIDKSGFQIIGYDFRNGKSEIVHKSDFQITQIFWNKKSNELQVIVNKEVMSQALIENAKRIKEQEQKEKEKEKEKELVKEKERAQILHKVLEKERIVREKELAEKYLVKPIQPSSPKINVWQDTIKPNNYTRLIPYKEGYIVASAGRMRTPEYRVGSTSALWEEKIPYKNSNHFVDLLNFSLQLGALVDGVYYFIDKIDGEEVIAKYNENTKEAIFVKVPACFDFCKKNCQTRDFNITYIDKKNHRLVCHREIYVSDKVTYKTAMLFDLNTLELLKEIKGEIVVDVQNGNYYYTENNLNILYDKLFSNFDPYSYTISSFESVEKKGRFPDYSNGFTTYPQFYAQYDVQNMAIVQFFGSILFQYPVRKVILDPSRNVLYELENNSIIKEIDMKTGKSKNLYVSELYVHDIQFNPSKFEIIALLNTGYISPYLVEKIEKKVEEEERLNKIQEHKRIVEERELERKNAELANQKAQEERNSNASTSSNLKKGLARYKGVSASGLAIEVEATVWYQNKSTTGMLGMKYQEIQQAECIRFRYPSNSSTWYSLSGSCLYNCSNRDMNYSTCISIKGVEFALGLPVIY